MLKVIKRLFRHLTDDREQTIENRLFYSAVIVSFFITLVAFILSLVLDQPVLLSLVGIFLLILLGLMFYYIRYRNLIKPFIPVYVFLCMVANTSVWIFDGGNDSQNIIILSFTFILSVIIVPASKRIWVLFLFLLLVILLYAIQVLRPEWIHPFRSETARWIDGLTTILYSIVFIYLIIHFLLRNYAYEKLKADKSESTLHNLNRTLESRISERTRELSDSMERFQALLNSTAEGIYGMDMTGNFTFVNTSALKTLGYISERELLGRNVHSLIHHSHPDGRAYEEKDCRVSGALKQQIGTHADDEYLWRSDGRMFPVEYWSFPILIDGSVQGAVVTFLDITERKKSEKELRKAKLEAEIANNAKSEFLTNVSHEFRTPLNSVLGYADLLETAEGGLRKEYSDSIRSNGMRLLDMVDDILELIRMEKAEFELDNNNIATSEFFSGFERAYATSVSDKALSFRTELAEDLPSTVIIDGTRLRLVINNLLDNAVKFTEKGEILLKIYHKRSEAPNRRNRTSLIVEVKDTGRGISEEHQKRLFQAFSQAEKKTNSNGLGIGLSITKNIVTRMGGSIKVISQPGMGSRFIVTFNDIEFTSGNKVQQANEPGPSKGTEVPVVNKAEITDLPVLLSSLEGHFMNLFSKFETKQPIGDVIKFGTELTELGIMHNCQLISEYGRDLTDAAHSFHIDNMLKLIRRYPGLVSLLSDTPSEGPAL